GERDRLRQRDDRAAIVAELALGHAEVVPGFPQRGVGVDGALEALGGALVGLGPSQLERSETGVEVAEPGRLRHILFRLCGGPTGGSPRGPRAVTGRGGGFVDVAPKPGRTTGGGTGGGGRVGE